MATESWRNRKTLILSRTDMMGLLTPGEYNDCVEHAFRMHGLGRVYMEPKGHIVLDDYPGEFEVMPSFIEDPPAAACKWVSIREDNERFGLPTVFVTGLDGEGSGFASELRLRLDRAGVIALYTSDKPEVTLEAARGADNNTADSAPSCWRYLRTASPMYACAISRNVRASKA